MKLCIYCKAEIPVNSLFCAFCGKSVEIPEDQLNNATIASASTSPDAQEGILTEIIVVDETSETCYYDEKTLAIIENSSNDATIPALTESQAVDTPIIPASEDSSEQELDEATQQADNAFSSTPTPLDTDVAVGDGD